MTVSHAARQFAIMLSLIVMMLGAGTSARADNPIERLLSPGALVEAHAKQDNNCDACHKPFSKEAQDSLCLDCHKATKADIASKTGFHGRSSQLKGLSCNHCHTDHEGRDANIVPLNPMVFNHDETDYPLTDRHRQVPCSSCHEPGKRWAEAPTACFDCHQKDDPHKKNLGEACESCHAVSGWREVRPFEHGKTRFPLRGKHAEVACGNCHIDQNYKNVGLECNDCHAIQDVHQERFGRECSNCHTEVSWKPVTFDHETSTRFPLRGAHAKASCESCHGESIARKVSVACASCHREQDVHRGQLGNICEDCHNALAWDKDVAFDHGLTNYPLTGLHTVVACEACHATPAYKDADMRCSDCHADDDVHDGRFATRCEGCHSANGWSRVNFDHGKQTKFALTGAHAKAGCYSCHRQKNVADASLPTSCYACHAKEDVHRGAFGRDCGSCHSTSTFRAAFIRRKKQ